jgi:hypothetical protein
MEEIEEWLLRMGRVFPQDPEMFGYRAIGQRLSQLLEIPTATNRCSTTGAALNWWTECHAGGPVESRDKWNQKVQ